MARLLTLRILRRFQEEFFHVTPFINANKEVGDNRTSSIANVNLEIANNEISNTTNNVVDNTANIMTK